MLSSLGLLSIWTLASFQLSISAFGTGGNPLIKLPDESTRDATKRVYDKSKYRPNSFSDLKKSGHGALLIKDSSCPKMVVPQINMWFMLGEFIAIISAYFFPNIGCSGGLLRSDIVVSQWGIFLLFFLKGLSVSMDEVKEAWVDWRVNFITQLFSSAIVPLFTWAFIAPFVTDNGFRDGLICLSAIPCALNTAVTQAASAGAKTSTAFMNGLIGRLLGIILVPATVAVLMKVAVDENGAWNTGGGMSGVQLLSTLRAVGLLVLLPMLVSQLVRRVPLLRKAFTGFSENESIVDEIILLALVQQSFSDTFLQRESINKSNLAYCIVLMPLIYLVSNALFWNAGKKLLRDVDVRVRSAATICACQKSLSFGLPFIRTAFGHRTDLAEIVAPLLVYNMVQLVLGTTVVVPIPKHNIKRYTKKMRRLRASKSSVNVLIDGRHAVTTDITHSLQGSSAGDHQIAVNNDDDEEDVDVDVDESEPESAAVSAMQFLRLLHKSMVRGRVRAALTAMCGLCVSLELAEDLIQDIPILDKLAGRFKIQYAVLFLTLIHLLNNLAELLDNLENQEEFVQRERIKAIILDSKNQCFTSEEEAARAYDRAALEIYGRGAALNFHYPIISDGVASRFRGVKWSSERKSWTVDPGSLGYDDYEIP